MNRDLGADPVQLDELGRNFDLGATSLAEIGNRVAHQFGQAEWFGSDAEQVRYDWDSYYHGRCHTLADMLREAAQLLWRQAEQQRRTSTDLGGHGSIGGTYPPGLSGLSGLLGDLGNFFIDDLLLKLGIAGLVQDISDLQKHFPDLAGLVKHIPADLLKVTKILGPFGDPLQILIGAARGDWDEVALGALSLGLAGVVVVAGVAGMPLLAGAAAVMGTGLAVYEIGTAVYEALPAIIEIGGAGIELVTQIGGELIGPAVSAIAEPISAGVQAGVEMVTDVAAPIVNGVADFAGDAWDAGANALDRINPF